MEQKTEKNLFVSEIIAPELVSLNVPMKNKIIFIGSQCVSKQSQGFACQKGRVFPTQFSRQWSMKIVKVLWCRFQQCLNTFTLLLVEESSETGVFRHLSNHLFRVRNFGNTKAMRFIFCFKTFKISVRFQKCSKKLRKSFFFSDKCIWIGIVKLSLLRTRYFSSVANVWTSSPNIWHVNRRDICKHNFLASYQWIW